MVFCFANLSYLLHTMRKMCSKDKNFGPRISKFFRSIKQFIRTVKIQNNFWWQNVFLTCSWRFPKSNESEQLEFKPEKLLGFRNMQEKLEKAVNLPYLQKTDFASFYINELTLTNVKRMLDIRFILWMVSNAKIFPLKNSLVNKKTKIDHMYPKHLFVSCSQFICNVLEVR